MDMLEALISGQLNQKLLSQDYGADDDGDDEDEDAAEDEGKKKKDYILRL